MTRFQLSIKFGGDWHIGDGVGRQGSVDSLVRRDLSTKLPFVPAKTLTGILRDACETIAQALDDGSTKSWSAVVDALFGSQPADGSAMGDAAPVRARLSIRPAAFSKEFSERCLASPALLNAVTYVKPGVAIEAATGTAVEEQLRMEEVVRGGCTLNAYAELDSSGLAANDLTAMTALLWAGTRAVLRIGGKRRRGLGRCTISLMRENGGDFVGIDLAQIRDYVDVLSKNKPAIPSRPVTTLPVVASSSGWHEIPVTLTTRSPVVIAAGVIGNVVRCLDFLPGTHLLGPLARLAEEAVGGSLRDQIAAGEFQVLNAYPAVDAERGLPIPYSLYHDKVQGGLDGHDPRLVNLAGGEAPPSGYKQHRRGYISTPQDRGALPEFASADIAHVTHNTITDDRQRPVAPGGVFTYQALHGGQVFRGAIRCSKHVADALDAQGIQTEIRAGIAKKDDYGRVAVTLLPSRACACETRVTSSSLVVWLLSDVLLRSAGLHSDASVLRLVEILREQLQCDVTIRHAYSRERRIDGWIDRWHLPRPTLAAVQAGSVLELTVEGVTSFAPVEAMLSQIERQGLGERRAEGFGEVRFNPPFLTTPFARRRRTSTKTNRTPLDLDPQSSAQPGTLPEGDVAFARVVETAAWREYIVQEALAVTGSRESREQIFKWNPRRPSNAQLGLLRSLIASAERSELAQISTWLGKAADADKWPRPAAEASKNLLTNGAWSVLQKDPAVDWASVAITRNAQQLKSEFDIEALRTLVIAAIRAEVRDREKGR